MKRLKALLRLNILSTFRAKHLRSFSRNTFSTRKEVPCIALRYARFEGAPGPSLAGFASLLLVITGMLLPATAHVTDTSAATGSTSSFAIPTQFNGDVLSTMQARYADGSNAGPATWTAPPSPARPPERAMLAGPDR